MRLANRAFVFSWLSAAVSWNERRRGGVRTYRPYLVRFVAPFWLKSTRILERFFFSIEWKRRSITASGLQGEGLWSIEKTESQRSLHNAPISYILFHVCRMLVGVSG